LQRWCGEHPDESRSEALTEDWHHG
jgi:hypothetical protein